QRKYMMFELSDAFAILPGGFGTLDEAFEIITWRKLRLHDKPILLADLAGYWQPFLALVDHVIGQGFAAAADRCLYDVAVTVGDVCGAAGPAPYPGLAAQPDRL